MHRYRITLHYIMLSFVNFPVSMFEIHTQTNCLDSTCTNVSKIHRFHAVLRDPFILRVLDGGVIQQYTQSM